MKNSDFLVNAGLADLSRARIALHKAMEGSRILGDDLANVGPRLQLIAQRIPALEAAFAPLRSHRKVLADLGGTIDKAIEPASAVLRVFEAMHDLERSLLIDPQHDVVGYIGLMSHLEDASAFLSANCSMAIQRLKELMEFFKKNQVLIDDHIARIVSQLDGLVCSGECLLDGGLQDAALDRLENELQRLLAKECLSSFSATGVTAQKRRDCRSFPVETVKMLRMIAKKLVHSGRKHRCIDVYVAIRSEVVLRSLEALQLDYVHYGSTENKLKLQWKSFEMHIARWTQHIEVIVKSVFEPEHLLCSQVLEKAGVESWENCFGRIALGGGILHFLQFGEAATKSKDDPQKLFKLLDMFEAMSNLRSSFAKMFGNSACKDVQQKSRDLLKQIVLRAHDILLKLKQQLEKQRDIQFPIDGSLPRVSSFVLSYIKHLVGDFYGPIMSQILTIHHSWKVELVDNKTQEEGLLSQFVISIMKILVVNFDEWAGRVEDSEPALFHLFLCNNYWYLAMFCKAPEFKVLVGESWVKEQQHKAELHAVLYIQEGWSAIAHHLSIPDITTLTGSRAATKDTIKTKLKNFYAAFESFYQKHCNWIVPDVEIREKLCVKVVKTIVPPYRTYLQTFGPLLEQEGSRGKYTKFSVQNLEQMVGSLFQARPDKIISGPHGKFVGGSTAIAQHATAVGAG